MKNKFLIYLVLSTLILSSVVFAAPSGSNQSDVSIEFEAGTDPVPPVDPENPGTGTGEPGTGQAGPLSLDWVPNLDFGTAHKISQVIKSYPVTNKTAYIQTTDLRGTGAGWKVTAALEVFTAGAKPSLNGAYLDFTAANLDSATVGIESPTAAPFKLTSDNTETLVVSAALEKMAGRGTWVTKFYNSVDVVALNLVVPAASASVGAQKSKIMWTIYDAP